MSKKRGDCNGLNLPIVKGPLYTRREMEKGGV